MNSTLLSKTAILLDVAGLFLKLGTTAFGGPASHIALMEQEAVVRRGWLSREEFLDLLGVANLLPGPTSTELAIMIGYRRAGWIGLVLAGVCFIVPAAVMVSAIAWAYLKFGKLPEIRGLLYGIKPVIIAVVVQALWHLGRTAVKTWMLGVVGVGAAALSYFGVNPLLVLLLIGVLMMATRLRTQPQGATACVAPLLGMTSAAPLAAATATVTPFSLWALALFFLKVGFVLFGSGYVLLAFLRADLVEHWHWLTENQLLDAVAVGQFTPGPVFTAATFIGYILGGPKAALLATVAIFLPSFVLVAVSRPLAPRLRKSPPAGAFLDGVNVASLALMAVVAWQLGQAALVDWLTRGLAVAATVWLLFYRVNSTWLILGGAALGLARSVFQASP